MYNKIKRGFTIVELVIVIAVIAILAGVLIPTFSSVTRNAKKSAAQQQAKNAMEATLALTGGSYPEGTDFVVSESTSKAGADYWFEYKGNKLTDIEVKDGALERYDSNTGYYAVYFSSKCFEGDKHAENLTASLKILEAAMKQKDNTFAIGTNTVSSTATDGYYSLTVGSGDTAKTFRIYFTSDIEPTLIIVMGKNYTES